LAAFVVQAALALGFHLPHATDVSEAIVQPLLVTLVYAFVWLDAQESPPSAAIAWERFLERAWAVIVIDFFFGQVAGFAVALSLLADPIAIVLGLLGCGVSALLVLADASATVDDDVTAWSVIPKSIAKSIVSTWNAVTFSRALALFSIQLLLYVIEKEIGVALTQARVSEPDFWSTIPLSTIAIPPLSAITLLVYRDATGTTKQAGSSSDV
jgi:hypothetical protein